MKNQQIKDLLKGQRTTLLNDQEKLAGLLGHEALEALPETTRLTMVALIQNAITAVEDCRRYLDSITSTL